jgi:hypothetical protein
MIFFPKINSFFLILKIFKNMRFIFSAKARSTYVLCSNLTLMHVLFVAGKIGGVKAMEAVSFAHLWRMRLSDSGVASPQKRFQILP